jgi:colanic acid biosynthesis protein WcaH
MSHRKTVPKQAREPKPGQWIEPAEFTNIVRLTPLVAIDLIVRSPDRRVLVGRRTNEPAKDLFFVPGSRISKNETRAAAFRRITREELGIGLEIESARFVGVFDHIYLTNRFEQGGFGTHYVTLAYELALAVDLDSLPREQHGEYVWLTPSQLLRSTEVHENTKAYFIQNARGAGPSTLRRVR